MTGGKHYKEISSAMQYHGIVSDSRSISSFFLDRDGAQLPATGGKVGYLENDKSMQWKVENRSIATDPLLYLQGGPSPRNVILDGIIRHGKISNDVSCAIKNESFEPGIMDGDLSFLKKIPVSPVKSKCFNTTCGDHRTRTSVSFLGRSIDRVPGCVKNFKKIRELNLSINKIKKIEHVNNLVTLERLNLGVNKISKIDGLDELKELKNLNLSANQVEKMENLEELKKLEGLHLLNNKITKIEGLESLERLKVISLSGNHISEIEGIDRLKSLNELWAGRNRIKKMKGLHELALLQKDTRESGKGNPRYRYLISRKMGLKRLHLEFNFITKIEGIDDLEKLEYLKLDNNFITRIDGLEKLENLEILDLSRNRIEKIEGLENLKKLKILNLESNRITGIDGLENLSELLTLMLSGNDISGEERDKFKNERRKEEQKKGFKRVRITY
jgi:Leucine-rich repeat (LRR) protein